MQLLSDPKHVRGDLRTIESALKRGWEIPDAVFESLPKIVAQILLKGSNREKIAAGRLLAVLHKQNNADQPVVQHHQHVHAHVPVPVTVDNIDERKRELAARIARLRD